MGKIISGYRISDPLIKLFSSDNDLSSFIKKVETACLEAKHEEEFTPEMAIRNQNLCLINDSSMTKCNPEKLKQAFITLASLGLLANTASKEAYILTFGGKADLRIGVSGHCKIIQKVFPKSKIYSKLLSVADKVSQKITGGASEVNIDIDFEKNLDLNKKENILGVYISLKYKCYLREEIIPISYINDVELSRNNRGSANDIWKKHYGAMATKTALIKFSKDLVMANQSKFPEVFYKALEAEAESSGFPPIKRKEIEVKEPANTNNDKIDNLEEIPL